MSRKERSRLTVLVGVKDQELTRVQAAELMGGCYRQSKRIWQRYQAEVDAGLVHRLRGQASARRKPAALRTQILTRYAEKRYADFGPTLMAEHPTGRLAPRLVGRARPQVRLDGDGGRRDQPAAGALLLRGDHAGQL